MAFCHQKNGTGAADFSWLANAVKSKHFPVFGGVAAAATTGRPAAERQNRSSRTYSMIEPQADPVQDITRSSVEMKDRETQTLHMSQLNKLLLL
jgi:hypothetical protein